MLDEHTGSSGGDIFGVEIITQGEATALAVKHIGL